MGSVRVIPKRKEEPPRPKQRQTGGSVGRLVEKQDSGFKMASIKRGFSSGEALAYGQFKGQFGRRSEILGY
jgi:hypothetical protein